MKQYAVEIWMAFAETFGDKDQFQQWLLHNGYPELAALSSAIKGSEEALAWLMKHQFFHFAAIDGTIDGQTKAASWLLQHGFDAYFHLAGAVIQHEASVEWPKQAQLEIFLVVAVRIREWREQQTFDYHKIQF